MPMACRSFPGQRLNLSHSSDNKSLITGPPENCKTFFFDYKKKKKKKKTETILTLQDLTYHTWESDRQMKLMNKMVIEQKAKK